MRKLFGMMTVRVEKRRDAILDYMMKKDGKVTRRELVELTGTNPQVITRDISYIRSTYPELKIGFKTGCEGGITYTKPKDKEYINNSELVSEEYKKPKCVYIFGPKHPKSIHQFVCAYSSKEKAIEHLNKIGKPVPEFGGSRKWVLNNGEEYAITTLSFDLLDRIEIGDYDGWIKEWSKSLASQMLSKQQLDLTYKVTSDEIDEIKKLSNTTVKKKLLDTFDDISQNKQL